MNRESVIELTELTKKYHDLTAVDHLNLNLYQGEVFGLLGPNGAGKSTTILMILGLTEPSFGQVRVFGIDSTRNPIEVKKKIGFLPDNVGFYNDRSGLENLMYTAQLNQIPANEARTRAYQMLRDVGLEGVAHKKAGEYSRGMRQRLGLADVLIKKPRIIILDEPTLGIDPEGVREFLQLIVTLSKEQGITVLLSSHHLHQVQQVCDRVGIFVEGKLLAEGDIPSLSQKLFNGTSMVIEAAISAGDQNGFSPNGNNSARVEQLRNELLELQEVDTIELEDNVLRIGCTEDISPVIARKTIASGCDLHRLTRKEYGLDELYHRYFEGGKKEYNNGK